MGERIFLGSIPTREFRPCCQSSTFTLTLLGNYTRFLVRVMMHSTTKSMHMSPVMAASRGRGRGSDHEQVRQRFPGYSVWLGDAGGITFNQMCTA